MGKVTGMETSSSLPAKTEDVEAMQGLQIAVHKMDISADAVKKAIAPNATTQELTMFLGICRSMGLNPFKREVYFIKYGQERAQTIVGYQTYIDRGERSGQLNGWEVEMDNEENPTKATITIYRKDWTRSFRWTVYRKEVEKLKRDGTPQATWETQPRFQLMKCAIAQGFRLAFPSECGNLPYIAEEITHDNGYQKVQPTAYITGAEAVNADVDIDYLRGQYFKYGKELFGDDQDARHNWQEKNVGKASLTDWNVADFQKALDIIDNARDLGQDAPETYLEEEGGEIPIEEAETVIDVEFDVPLPPTKADKIKQIVDMVEMTPIGSVKEAAFKTWAAGILGKSASDLSNLPEADLDRLIKELNTRLDDEADKQGELI